MYKKKSFRNFLKFFCCRLIRYYAPGIHERLSRINSIQPPPLEIENVVDPVEIGQMVQVLSIIPCGILVASILLILEILIKKIKIFGKIYFFVKN